MRHLSLICVVTSLLVSAGCPGRDPQSTPVDSATTATTGGAVENSASGPSAAAVQEIGAGETGAGEDIPAHSEPVHEGGTLEAPTPDAGGDPVGATSPDPAHDAEWKQWPAPAATLVVTGRQHGYIEPCGCTGLSNQKGGLSRKMSLISELRDRGWDVAPLDVGNQVRRFGRQPEIKFQTTVEGMKTIGYQAIGLGPDDLRLSFNELLPVVAHDINRPSVFVSANVNMFEQTSRFLVLEVGGKKVGVTGVLGSEQRERVQSDEIELSDASEALAAVLPELTAQSCDLYLLLAHASIAESQELARKFSEFDVVVTAGGAGEPTRLAEPIEGSSAVLVQVGTKGMYAGVIGIYDDQEQPLRYERVALDARWQDSPEMLDLLAAYQYQLEVQGLEGLGLRPVRHPTGREFVGSATCGECHTQAFEVWEGTPHAHATETLVHPPERYEVARHVDPECLSCHVTGWSPQGYFPYVGGYLDLNASSMLHGNGCENCHGPGSQHVATQNGDIEATDDDLRRLQAEMRITYDDAEQKCLECHDLDNSPDFHEPGAFARYWEEVKHEGKD